MPPTSRNHWIEKYIKRTDELFDQKLENQNKDMKKWFEGTLNTTVTNHKQSCEGLEALQSINQFLEKQKLKSKYIFLFERRLTKSLLYKILGGLFTASTISTIAAYVMGWIRC